MKYQGVFPEGKFGCISADPPWPGGLRFPTFKKDRPVEEAVTGCDWNYSQMSMPELYEMAPLVREHALPGAHLWLWTTNMFLLSGEALELCRRWGFTPKALLTWDKVLVGLGRWMRGQTEHVIWATDALTPGAHLLHKGPDTLPTLIREKRRRHSQKPDAFWQYPEKLSPAPRLEIFSRSLRVGWENVISEQPAPSCASGSSTEPTDPAPQP